MNILFTCAGRRNYLINYFKEALDGKGVVIATDVLSSAPSMADADISIRVPEIHHPDYISILSDISRKHKADAIISLNDLELPVLAENRSVFENSGTRVLVSDPEVIDITFDKWRTHSFLESIGLRSPKTYLNLTDALNAIEQGHLSYPLVVKPRRGSASFGIEYPHNKEELICIDQLLRSKIQRSPLPGPGKRELVDTLIFQEKINGDEYGVDVLNDFEGNYFGSFARKKLAMRCGETDKAISVVNPGIEKIGRAIGTNLKHIGSLDCDILEKDGEFFVLELNPRFGGGYPFSHEAGVDTPSIYLSWLSGVPYPRKNIKYTAGLQFSKCDRMIKIQ